MPAVRLRADYARCEIVLPDRHEWVASPQRGVERVMLDREGAETGRATSIVRYAPGSHFPAHRHPRGEEILVLQGTFSEGEQHFPAGWYLRNPPGSLHQPSSAEGTTLLVKLGQMRSEDRSRIRIDTSDPSRWVRLGGRDVCPLHADAAEDVVLLRLEANTSTAMGHAGGAEVFVVCGGLVAGARAFLRGTWLRLPPGAEIAVTAGGDGASLYLKTGHLAHLVARS
ncbi:cupin domain-containing protein [Acidovorax sp. MR-S7]|uniref:cupin domain-containing protein n=1 Tax=Acidovorax sp. MR-S7 TaxID=1268622 RepID=UPI00035C5928|nr:cupin domain-containing protein [Acidovorax sp. MR-S7]GAD21695.1 anti-sigma factor [Acidovorax sp. MR-S7]